MKKILAVMLCALLLWGCSAQTPATTTTLPAETQEQTPSESTPETTEAAPTLKVTDLFAQLETIGLPNMLDMDPQMQLDIYGIRAEAVKQAKVVICSDGLRADEIWLIEAVSAAEAEEIKSLAEGRLKQKDAESITYSPEQNVIVKKSYIAMEGNFVIFLCSPDVEAMTATVNAAFGK